MPIPTSGTIKMSEIKSTLGSSSNSIRAYAVAAKAATGDSKFDAPDKMSEFYSYSSPAPTPTVPTPTVPTPYVPTPVAPSPNVPTPTPAVTATVTYDCNGTSSTSGRIFITDIANGGSACYVGYSTQSGNPAIYATTYIGSATSYTFTGVADYNGSYRVYIYNSDTGTGASYGLPSNAISCYAAPTPTVPTPTVPTPTVTPGPYDYSIVLSSGATACEAKNNFVGPNP